MKNRVLLTMLIIFIVLAGVWITCGTIFVVRDVQIIDTTVQTAEAITDDEKDDIVEKSGLLGKNILFNLNHDKIAQSVKSVSPMLKVQSVTAEFPNKIILKISRRVPVYYINDNNNQMFFDAEMCRVEGTKAGCIDITSAGLKFARDLAVGDLAVGNNDQSQCKINQLKVIASYFPSLENFEIAYDDDSHVVGDGRVSLSLKIKSGVTFKIKIYLGDDFLNALEFTDQIYQKYHQVVSGGADGVVYRTVYRENKPGKVKTSVEDEKGNLLIGDWLYEE